MPQMPMLCPSPRFTGVDLANFERQRRRRSQVRLTRGLGKSGRCRKLPMLGGTSGVFLLKASSPLQEGGHAESTSANLGQPQHCLCCTLDSVLLCDSIVSAIVRAPGGQSPCLCFPPDFHHCPMSQLCLDGKPNPACTPPGLRSPPCY